MAEVLPEVTDYAKFQGFVTQTLEPKLKEQMDARDILVEELNGYQQVQQFVEQTKQQNGPQLIRNLVEVGNGSGVLCQAEAIASSEGGVITLKIGLDTYVELSYEEATEKAKECEMFYIKKLQQLDSEISTTVNDIEDILHTLAELKKVEGQQ